MNLMRQSSAKRSVVSIIQDPNFLQDDKTALILAAEGNHSAVVVALLELGPGINIDYQVGRHFEELQNQLATGVMYRLKTRAGVLCSTPTTRATGIL